MTECSEIKPFMDLKVDRVIEDSCQGAYDQEVARYRAERVGSKQNAELTARIRVVRHPSGNHGSAYYTTSNDYDYPLIGRGPDFFETVSAGLLTLERSGKEEIAVPFPEKSRDDEDTRFNPNWSKSETYLGGEFYKMGNCKSATVRQLAPVFNPAFPDSIQGSTEVSFNFSKQLEEDKTASSTLDGNGEDWAVIPQESCDADKRNLSKTTEPQRFDTDWTLVDNDSEAGEEDGLWFDEEAFIDDCTLREAVSAGRQN